MEGGLQYYSQIFPLPVSMTFTRYLAAFSNQRLEPVSPCLELDLAS